MRVISNFQLQMLHFPSCGEHAQCVTFSISFMPGEREGIKQQQRSKLIVLWEWRIFFIRFTSLASLHVRSWMLTKHSKFITHINHRHLLQFSSLMLVGSCCVSSNSALFIKTKTHTTCVNKIIHFDFRKLLIAVVIIQ
jgi:hypothetical protein